MSENFIFHDHQTLHNDVRRTNTGSAATFRHFFPADSSADCLQMFEYPNSDLSFTEFMHGSSDHNSPSGNSFGLPSTGFSEQKLAAGLGETPATPNSSISSSSTEVVGGDEGSNKSKKSSKVKDDGEEFSKKEATRKKKGEKKEKQARFAFMTKSEVDHLEDGYRWRKYGQKAVKNSPYPRSYYRCTTQQCPVKKRVERSFEDPSIVITTYEGQHNHHLPASIRGNVAGIFASSMITQPLQLADNHSSFPQESVLQTPHLFSCSAGSSSNVYHPETLTPYQQLHQRPDYGLLQDMIQIPPVFHKEEP